MDDLAGPANEPDEECLNRARAVFANTLDGVHVYFRHQQRLDDLRQHVINELASSSKHAENQEISSTDRLNYVLGLQKKLYDLQLLEAASKTPLFGIAKTIFSLSKKRTMPKVEEVSKEKPMKGKLNSSTSFKDGIRKPEREPKFPVTPKPSLNVSTSSLNTIPKQQDESSVTGANTTPRMRRIGIRRRHSSFSQKVVENPRASVENDEEKEYGANSDAQRYTKLPILSPNMRSSKPPKEKNDEPPESNSPSTPVSIGPPPEKVTRKRAAAVIAVAATADIITPRATSPRKRANNNNPQAATQLDEAPPDEPTYCTCKQVSFGDMICCDNNKCPIEWFHFGCVNIKVKPTKGKKWFCPDCRHGDKQTVLKPSLMKK